MKRKVIPIITVITAVIGVLGVIQLPIILQLASIRDNAVFTSKDVTVESIVKTIEKDTQGEWTFVELVCPYEKTSFEISPVFGINIGTQTREEPETSNSLVFKNKSGDRTYISINIKQIDFCTKQQSREEKGHEN
jgi:hypothetical protein